MRARKPHIATYGEAMYADKSDAHTLEHSNETRETLTETVRKADCADQFVYFIQTDSERAFMESGDPRQQGLLTDLYDWEQSTIKNRERFKHCGWFHIAKEYYKQHKNQ